MCLAQGPQRSDASEALTRGPSVSSQALYHCTSPYLLVGVVVVVVVVVVVEVVDIVVEKTGCY